MVGTIRAASDSSIPRFVQLRERHSRRSRAPTPGGSNRCTRLSTRSTCSASDLELRRQLCQRGFEVAVVVEVVDDRRADPLLGLVEARQPSCHIRWSSSEVLRVSVFSSVWRRSSSWSGGVAVLPVVGVILQVFAPVEFLERVQLLHLDARRRAPRSRRRLGLLLARAGSHSSPVVSRRARRRCSGGSGSPSARRLSEVLVGLADWRRFRPDSDRAARASGSTRARSARPPPAPAATIAGS